MPNKREILGVLSRPELIEIAGRFEVHATTRSSKDDVVEALAASHRATLPSVLEGMKRERLKEVCRALGLDDSGREKAVLVERLSGARGVAAPAHAHEHEDDHAHESESPPEPASRRKRGNGAAKKNGGARYRNRAVTTLEVIEELIKIAKAMQQDKERGTNMGLTPAEVAFYDALADNKSALELMGEPVLTRLAQELARIIRLNATIDWNRRETVRARMRSLVRRLLRKYKYPPDRGSPTRTVGLDVLKLSRGIEVDGPASELPSLLTPPEKGTELMCFRRY